ncbi:MAG: trypsin-like serine protease with C-terminal domain [Planctomycetota bacterium]|nr:trypsin-like serine protease with C-terminal domain [Planctomycetota bacterium]
MASFETIDHFGHDEPPPRPTTPPVRRGFLIVLAGLSLAAGLVYGIPFVIERAGYAYEAGRSRAAEESLKRLEKAGAIRNASSLFRLAAAKVSPAVVNIRSFRTGKANNNRRGGSNLVPAGIGSGVVIDKARGLIVTNHHVIKDGEQFIVRPGRGGEWPAQVVGVDENTDLAVLQVKAPFLVEAEWGDPETLAVGDWVLAIGSPFMLDQSVSAGIVSATGRNNLGVVGEGSYEDFLQTDAAVNPGNSGGPLVDLRGRVVGINTAISIEGGRPGDSMPGIGLAISATLAKRVTEQLIKNGKVTRGYIGVFLRDLRPADAQDLKFPANQGAVIEDVDPDAPAHKAGLKRGDVVVKLDEQPIPDLAALRIKTSGLAIGSDVPIEFVRDGKPLTARITIGTLPVLRILGIRLRDQKNEGGEPIVVIDQVQPGSLAFREGLRPGYQVVAVNQRPVHTKAEADQAADALDPSSGIPLTLVLPNGKLAPMTLGGAPKPP